VRLRHRLSDRARRESRFASPARVAAAGLVTSRREGKMVMYAMAPAGAALLATLSAEVPA
jgi:DNA-binding transcriptional ArsR family regulator